MKYLHNDALSELTTFLTDLPLGGEVSQRVLYGRLEAFSMKRGSDDKKYAFKLGEKFVASLENLATDVSTLKKATRKRSQSAGVFEEMSMPLTKLGRNRSCSFDTTRRAQKVEFSGVQSDSELDQMTELPDFSRAAIIPSGLGNFAEQGTRRLMTDLILTLNMSFPDFDFAAVQPSDFVNLSTSIAMDRINKRLSDVALHKETFLTDLWTTVDSVMTLNECDVFCYQPAVSDDGDPMAFLTQTLTEDHGRNNMNVPPDDATSGTDSLSQPSITTIWSFNYFFVNKTAKRILLFTCVESMKSHKREEQLADEDFAVYVPSATDPSETDFDLDPEAAPAGGVPIPLV